MKTIRDFLRKHALLFLAALVVVSVPVGAALGKYAASETVTDKLNLNVSMESVEPITLVKGSTFNSKIKSYSPTYIEFCNGVPENAEKVDGVNLANDVGKTVYLYRDLADSKKLYVVPAGNVKLLANADCGTMFEGLTSLKEIRFTNFDTARTTTMQSLFSGCNALDSLDLRSFNTSNVTIMNAMFMDCTSLQNVDLSTFDTSKVTTIISIFRGCSALKQLDISSFTNNGNFQYVYFSFYDCTNLERIYASSDFTFSGKNLSQGHNCFTNCNALIGGDGKYASSRGNVTYTYARVGNANRAGNFTDVNLKDSLTGTNQVTFTVTDGFIVTQ